MLSMQPRPRWGIVRSVNAADQTVRVLIQPEGVLSGWLPVVQAAASGGWGVTALPMPGDMARLEPDGDSFAVTGFAHNDGNRPPAPPNAPGSGGAPSTGKAEAVAGEVILQHRSGSVIRLCADGTIYSRGTWRHDGDMTVNGNMTADLDVKALQNVRAVQDVTDRDMQHGSVRDLRDAYNAHHHPVPNVEPGPATIDSNTTDHPVE
ncbi:hypothetical protein [Rhodovastum atsumiense]|uniref:Baseplate assembly protein n=1 Tax=Rhodovastum atsumiense TaxID=504468 RepID=A0A5M6IN11_9PROT|nr:hypothetical protein [Rhodovastum atsumiense]KAA5609646.1 hypothetical protein F1189_23065 [Rhodovastum atsumiense]